MSVEFENMILTELAAGHGVVVAECFRCTKCSEITKTVHPFAEALSCNHCGHRNESKAPRRPVAGEVTADHLANAIDTLTHTYGNHALNRWSTPEEWAELDPKVQMLITMNITAAVTAVLKQIGTLATAFAKNGVA